MHWTTGSISLPDPMWPRQNQGDIEGVFGCDQTRAVGLAHVVVSSAVSLLAEILLFFRNLRWIISILLYRAPGRRSGPGYLNLKKTVWTTLTSSCPTILADKIRSSLAQLARLGYGRLKVRTNHLVWNIRHMIDRSWFQPWISLQKSFTHQVCLLWRRKWGMGHCQANLIAGTTMGRCTSLNRKVSPHMFLGKYGTP